MRDFADEYSTIGGFHDGLRARVIESSRQSPLVSIHEAMHGRIFRETPDGQLHAAYCQAVEQNSVNRRVADPVAASSRIFFEASRLPQESFATYLSVKALPSDQESNALAELAPEYRRYFRLIADIVDPNFSSSQLQFLIGWNCAVAVFSSPLLERFDSLDMSIPITLCEDEHPQVRFERLLESLVSADFEGLRVRLELAAREACRKNEMSPWDIFSEQAWLAVTFQNGAFNESPMLVELALSDSLREWLLTVLPFTFLHGGRLQAAFANYEQTMRLKLGISTTPWGRTELAGENVTDHDLAEAVHASDSRIVNAEVFRLRQIDSGILRSSVLFEDAASIAIYSASPPDRNLQWWSIFAWPKNGDDGPETPPGFFAEFQRSDVVSFLAAWKRRKDTGASLPRIRAIVIAIEGPLEFMETMTETEFILWKHEEFFDRLCWYVWGRFFEIYRMLSGKDKHLLAGRIDTDKKVLELIARPFEWTNYNGLVLKLLHVGEEPGTGLFMRAFPMQFAGPIMRFEQRLISDGKLGMMPFEMLERFGPIVKEALYAAQSLWCEY